MAAPPSLNQGSRSGFICVTLCHKKQPSNHMQISLSRNRDHRESNGQTSPESAVEFVFLCPRMRMKLTKNPCKFEDKRTTRSAPLRKNDCNDTFSSPRYNHRYTNSRSMEHIPSSCKIKILKTFFFLVSCAQRTEKSPPSYYAAN